MALSRRQLREFPGSGVGYHGNGAGSGGGAQPGRHFVGRGVCCVGGGLEAVRAGGWDGLAFYERKGGSSVLPLQGCPRGAAARTCCLLSVKLRSRAVLRGRVWQRLPGSGPGCRAALDSPWGKLLQLPTIVGSIGCAVPLQHGDGLF